MAAEAANAREQVPSDATTAPLQPSLTTSNSGKSSGLVGTVTLAAPKDTGDVPVTATTTSCSA